MASDGTMRCAACEAENPAAYRFCGECGARLPGARWACVHASPPGQRFCGECGAALADASIEVSAPAVAASRFQDVTAYTPKHLAEKILKTRSAVEGERKLVTVMFSDVSGFTAMSERLDPEEVHAIMDRAFQVIIEAVHRFEGNINQFLGDGVMALFGAPIAHEDHPQRAIRAALAIQDGLSPLKREVRQTHGVKFRVRMGINTGSVFVGAIGKDLRMDYTAVGDTTNLAARLLGLAGPGQILVSPATHRITDGYFTFEDRGEFKFKGKSELIRVYSVMGEVRGRSRLEVSKDRGLTPLVGRERELGQLVEAYHRASKGDGAIALLTGDPGVGKSRLLFEFLHSLEGTGLLELEATCLSYGASIPYHPILELLRRYIGLEDGLPSDEVRAHVEKRLESLGIQGDEPATLVAHFLGTSAPESFLLRLSGPQLKARTFDVLRTMLLRASEVQPVVLVVENVHWIDSSSEEFLKYLGAAVPGHRLLLLLTSRADHEVAWFSPPLAETIAVKGLEGEGVGRMTQALLGAERVSGALLDVLVDRGEGNPLYVEEILRQLRETGGVHVEAGEARLVRADLALPQTIHDIIAARIDRLPDDVKHTLQVAAVVGRQVAVPLLARAIEAETDLDSHLDALGSSDFLFLSALEPEPVYTFKHALTQDVAYSSLLERRRRVYHAAVGRGLEELRAGRLEDVIELLAYHFGKSVEGEKAVDYAIRAAEKAQRRWANAEALAQFEAALKRLASMPETDGNCLRKIDAVVKQAEVKFALGRHAEHVEALDAIKSLVDRVADPLRRATWYYWTAFLQSLVGGRPEKPISYCREALAIADANRFDDIRAFAEGCLAQVLMVAGDLRGALEVGERALVAFEARGNVWWACRTLWALSSVANYLGAWEQSLAYSRRGLEHGKSVNDLRLKVVGWRMMGSAHIRRGDPESGLRCCEEAVALSPIPFDTATVRGTRGYGLVKTGAVAAGLAELGEAVAWFQRSQLHFTSSLFSLWLAEAHLALGQRSEAHAILDTVLAYTRENEYRLVTGVAERLLGEALGPEDPAALEHLAVAAEILEEMGARNEIAEVLVAKAACHRVARDLKGARAELEQALAIFTSLGTIDGRRRAAGLLESLPNGPASGTGVTETMTH
jgi:class 3 adenylate cyclase/tetratricopeptide (TPR) repeat protein